jgi:hypothetical protein
MHHLTSTLIRLNNQYPNDPVTTQFEEVLHSDGWTPCLIQELQDACPDAWDEDGLALENGAMCSVMWPTSPREGIAHAMWLGAYDAQLAHALPDPNVCHVWFEWETPMGPVFRDMPGALGGLHHIYYETQNDLQFETRPDAVYILLLGASRLAKLHTFEYAPGEPIKILTTPTTVSRDAHKAHVQWVNDYWTETAVVADGRVLCCRKRHHSARGLATDWNGVWEADVEGMTVGPHRGRVFEGVEG